MYSPKSTQLLEVVKKSLDLVDPWRDRNPDKRIYSWMRVKNNKLQGSRIDFALTTTGIANKISQVEYKYGYQSDHSCLEMQVEISRYSQGLATGNLVIICSIMRHL